LEVPHASPDADRTHPPGNGPCRLRRTRYIGLRRVCLGHILTAVGLNVLRLGKWFLEIARAKTRITPFARLMADSAAA
jgi:hypothetical protein